MNNEEKERLYKNAVIWFVGKYGQSPEKLGCCYYEFWDKHLLKRDLRVHKLSTVVFGPSETEVKAFIKHQNIVCWGMIAFIYLMLFIAPLPLICLLSDNTEMLMWATAAIFPLCPLCWWLAHYLKPLEKLWTGRIVVYFNPKDTANIKEN